MRIIYSGCVFRALSTQHAMSVCHIVVCGLFGFPHCLINGTIFEKINVTEHKMCVLIFSIFLSETFLILGEIERYIMINVHRSVVL